MYYIKLFYADVMMHAACQVNKTMERNNSDLPRYLIRFKGCNNRQLPTTDFYKGFN